MKTERPKAETLKFFDYCTMANYLDEKYQINQRDYAKKFGEQADMSKPYLDFWHWAMENVFVYEHIYNGCYQDISFIQALDNTTFTEDNMWIKEILELYVKEFSDYWDNDPDGWFTVHLDW